MFDGKPSDILYNGYLNKDISFGDIIYIDPNNIQYKKQANGVIDRDRVEILSNFKISIVLHII